MAEDQIDLATRLVIDKLVLEDIMESQRHRERNTPAAPDPKPGDDISGQRGGPETAARISKARPINLELGNRGRTEIDDIEMTLQISKEEYDDVLADSFGADGDAGMEEAVMESRSEFERELHQRIYGRTHEPYAESSQAGAGRERNLRESSHGGIGSKDTVHKQNEQRRATPSSKRSSQRTVSPKLKPSDSVVQTPAKQKVASKDRRSSNKRSRRSSTSQNGTGPLDLTASPTTESGHPDPSPKPRQAECIICADSFPTSKLIRSSSCRETVPPHYYCEDCLRLAFQGALKDEARFPVKCCPASGPLEMAQVRKYFDKDFQELYRHREAEMMSHNRVYCHHPKCSAFIGAGQIKGDQAACSRCRRRTCTRCKKAYHPGKKCPQEDSDVKKTLKLGEKEQWQKCPFCKDLIDLHSGCNHIICQCHKEFCYLCGAAWKTCHCPVYGTDHISPEDQEVLDAEEARRLMEHDLDQWEFAGQFGVGMPELPPEAPNVFRRSGEPRDHQRDLNQRVGPPRPPPQPNPRGPEDVVREQNAFLAERSRRLREGDEEGRQQRRGRQGEPRMGLHGMSSDRDNAHRDPPPGRERRSLMGLWDVDDNWQMPEGRGRG